MFTLLQDLRFGLRMLARNPGFTAVAIITLALGIGATTAIFSVVYGVLLRPLPYPKPEQLVSVAEVASDGHLMRFADPNFDDMRAENHTLAAMAEYDRTGVETVLGPSGAERVGTSAVSEDFFRVMGIQPVVGRGFTAGDQRQGAALLAVASYGYWRQHLAASSGFSSLKFNVAGHAFAVVGIMPPGFSFPAGTDLWFARGAFGETPSRTAHNAHVVARLRNSATLAQARSDLSAIARRLRQQYQPEISLTDASVMPLQAQLTASVRPALLILLGAVGFLLLVACANVANLLIARAAARQHELAIRAAMGASRARLVSQFLSESLVLALCGGGLGTLAANWAVAGLLAIAPRHLPRVENVSVSLPVLGFALLVSFLVAAGLGLATAFGAAGKDPQKALAEAGRSAAGSLASQRLGRLLVAGQVAVTLVLLAGAGLLGRSLLRVLSVDPGFRVRNIVTMEIEVPGSQPTDIASAVRDAADSRPGEFMSGLFRRLRRIPGVLEAGIVSSLPLSSGSPPDGKFLLLDRQPLINFSDPQAQSRFEQLWATAPGAEADYCIASGGYFKALGIPLVRGRFFNARDTMASPQVALVSESLAKSVWPHQDPIGRTIEFGNMDGDMRLLTIVGVVGDVRDDTLEKPPAPTVYVNYRQRLRAGGDSTIVMQSSAPPASVLAAARRILRVAAPDSAPRFRTFQAVFDASVETRKFNVTLVAVFAGSALLLAMIGIYGVTTYWVTQRTREFGIRMALGAQRGDVLRMVARQCLELTAMGTLAGLGAGMALTRLMAGLLYDVKPNDPAAFFLACLALLAASALAGWLPARKATRVDPMAALRQE